MSRTVSINMSLHTNQHESWHQWDIGLGGLHESSHQSIWVFTPIRHAWMYSMWSNGHMNVFYVNNMSLHTNQTRVNVFYYVCKYHIWIYSVWMYSITCLEYIHTILLRMQVSHVNMFCVNVFYYVSRIHSHDSITYASITYEYILCECILLRV